MASRLHSVADVMMTIESRFLATGTGGAKPDLQMKNGCPVFNAANVRKAGGLANAGQFENALDAFRYDVGSRCARTDDRSMWR
jgi:hypothetical protein